MSCDRAPLKFRFLHDIVTPTRITYIPLLIPLLGPESRVVQFRSIQNIYYRLQVNKFKLLAAMKWNLSQCYGGRFYTPVTTERNENKLQELISNTR